MNGTKLAESLYSVKNQILLSMRSRLRFCRAGYKEAGISPLLLSATEQMIERKYELDSYADHLAEGTYKKNLWTLYILDKILRPHLGKSHLPLEILEPGCQDFSRLPALRTFFRKQELQPRITGLEIDPFPLLHDFHSRWDKAKYYLSLGNSADRYFDADFFEWSESANLICCFYPFVSVHPALAWGLPARFGNSTPWIDGYIRNLKVGGLLLVVHQGKWEEEDFDKARKGRSLRLLQREEFNLPFFPLPYSACASVYSRDAEG